MKTLKLAIGLGLAGGTLLVAWLLTGSRKKLTKEFLEQKIADIKKRFQNAAISQEDSDVHHI